MEKCKRCGMDLVKKSDRCRKPYCYRCYYFVHHKKRRERFVKNGCCAQCGEKVKPIKRIPYRCEECRNKIRSKRQVVKAQQSHTQGGKE